MDLKGTLKNEYRTLGTSMQRIRGVPAYKQSVKDGQTDDRQTDPYVELCFDYITKMLDPTI